MASANRRFGVLTLLDQMPGSELVKTVQALEALGYGSFWIPELLGREPVATAGYLLAQTRDIHVATGIANVYVRDPHAMVQARHTLSELSGGRFILGLGVSNVGMNSTRGHEWQAPARKLGQYLDAMDAITPDAAPANTLGPVHIAAHGPKLQALAGARSDGAITYLMSSSHTRLSRERLGERPDLSVVCMVLAEEDPARARATARKALAYYLTLDYYHREWRALGFDDADFRDGGSDALIDMLVGWGNADALHARVAEHLDAGASRILVMPLDLARGGVEGSETLRVLAP